MATLKLGHSPLWGCVCIGLLAAVGCSAGDNGVPSTEPVADENDEIQDAATFGDTFTAKDGAFEKGEFETIFGRETLEYQVVDNQKIFEGDIVLPDDGPDYRSGVISNFNNLWPNGIVPYESTGLFNDARVTAAIAHWQARVPVTFVAGATTGNRIKFVAPATNVCNSNVGMIGGAQTVNLGVGCNTGAAIHEIGHALGLWHEQSRNDRNSYVTVIPNCIQAGQSGNFNTFGASGINVGAYDIPSIMHYNSTAFLDTTKPGCVATITRTDGSLINLARNNLTGLDIAGYNSLYQYSLLRRVPVDYDKDGKADLAVWRPSNGTWYVINSSTGSSVTTQWGLANDVPDPGDFDGDGKGDRAVWRPSNGTWYVIKSSNNTSYSQQWGLPGDVPVAANYDGDGKSDLAVWRPSDGVWYVIKSSTGTSVTQQWGLPGDVPVPGNYDGDSKHDYAVWRPSNGTWYVIKSSNGTSVTQQWGLSGDIPVPGNYDGDSKTDYAVWRPSNGTWYVIKSSNGASYSQQWGLPGDIPVPADYDKDGKTDLAIWRPSTGTWWIVPSSTGAAYTAQWGLTADAPVP